MNIRDNKYKDFIYSSLDNNKYFIKNYILSFDDNIINDPPYITIKNNKKNIVINKTIYSIPKVSKHLILISKKNNNIIYENDIIKNIDNYNIYLSIIEKILITLRSDINNMDFYMLRISNNLLDIIDIILFEFKYSINILNENKYIIKTDYLFTLILNVKNSIKSKAEYKDMINSRVLSIVSVSALPILVLMNTWGVKINKYNRIFNNNTDYINYRITLLICILIIINLFYNYRHDLFY